MRIPARVTSLVVLALFSACMALEAQDSPQDSCESAGATQAELTRCAYDEYQVSHAALERLLAALRRTIDSAALPGLARAQQAWESYAREQCDWTINAYGGGSMAPMARAACMTALTDKRYDELLPYLCDWDGEVLSCDERADFERAERDRAGRRPRRSRP